MSQKTERIEKAADKVQLIAPLLSETLSTADRVDLQKRIAEEAGLSYRSIGRYVERFKRKKLQGLVDVMRKRDDLKTISDDVVEQAIILRRELPSRSIEDIIFILISEHFVGMGEIKRSTLQRRLQQARIFEAADDAICEDAAAYLTEEIPEGAQDDDAPRRHKVRAISSHRPERESQASILDRVDR